MGALICTLGDAGHVMNQVDGYYPSSLNLLPFGIPLWVPLQFGIASVVLFWVHFRFLKTLPPSRPIHWTRPLLAGAYFLSLYWFSSNQSIPTGNWKDFWMAVFSVFFWALDLFNRRMLVLAFFTALVGTGIEILFVHQFVFFYLPGSNNLWGVPSWLPWLYVTGSLTVSKVVLYSQQKLR